MRLRTVAFLLALACCLATPAVTRASAGEMADATRQALQSGAFADGDRKLAERLAADEHDDEARLGLGMIRFAEAIERFGQAQYRHGLRVGQIGMPIGLGFRVFPENPAPQPLTYEEQRATLQALLDDLARVEATLAPMGETNAKIALDLNAIQFHFSGPGAPDPKQTLGALIKAITARPTFRPPSGSTPAPALEPFDAVFDRADAMWLRAYAHVISAGLEFALAYDWRESFERYAGLFYAGARSAKPYDLAHRDAIIVPGETEILDLVGFVHSIHWRCAEPERMRSARRHFKSVVALNRQMWPVILARADDDKNWIPGPQQKNAAMPSLQVTEARVKAWRDAVELFDALLDGTKLAPHWRYAWGIDFEAFFDDPRDFDLVYWATGPGATPYLRQGPTIDRQQWNDMQNAFGGSFLTYLVWFN